MKHVVVGTAGHIDHGKTTLVKALTGVNTDRFKEERERGITIDIGFAPLPLGPHLTLGFVDVPGHERFVKNMLAGVWGIDMVLLVVAADESIKPQTREHFDICSLLRVKRGLVAMTKIDLADRDLADLAALEVREYLSGSFLEGAPIVPVSARTGEGLQALKDALRAVALEVTPGRASNLLRLPVDRAFTARGFGTVVTGTLVSGSLAEGDEVAVYPAGVRCRVRGLQVHGEPVHEAAAGQRTAVNLQGIDAAALVRGCVLSRPGALEPSSLLDVKLNLLPGAPAPLKDLARVRFHQGTSEALARVKILEASGPLAQGRAAFAQVRLESPGCCLPGDRFVIRRYSPAVTIGGGVVLDARPAKHRGRPDPALLIRLAQLESAGPAEALRTHLEGEPGGIPLPDLARRAGMTGPEAAALLEPAIAAADVLRAGDGAGATVLGREAAERLEGAVVQALKAYHRNNPLRAGMPREELRERAIKTAGPETARVVLDRLAQRETVRVERDTVSLREHQVTLSTEDEKVRGRLLQAFAAGGLNPPAPEEAARSAGCDVGRAEKIVHLLLASGNLVRLADGKLFDAAAIDGLKNRLWEMLPDRRVIDIGTFKELTGTSRKNAIPLLEHLDAQKVTRRLGSDREILPPPGG